MKTNSFVRSMALLAAIALAVPAFAKPVLQNFQLSQKTLIGKSALNAGEYRFLIDGNRVTVTKGRDTLAESEGRWEEREKKYEYTELVSTTGGQLLELRFAGKKSVFVLNQ
ncbi:MAG TPA: hypothetical protein VGR03_05045 [Candidatus Acidoferrum sp.]|nr:hypothetical protein [Candidatus Acidoferrum sp.]